MITLGIGCGADAGKVLASAEKAASEDVRVLCYSYLPQNESAYVGSIFSDRPHAALIDDLCAGKIDGAVRGTLPANETLRYLKTAYGVPRLERIALLETVHGDRFFLAPVGVDEGWSVEEKADLVVREENLHKGSACLIRPLSFPAGGQATSADTRSLTDRSGMRSWLRNRPAPCTVRF